MKEAKHCFILSNGITVDVGNKVEIIKNNGEKYVGNIIDISTTGIFIKLLNDECEFDAYFEELRDIKIID